MVYRALRRGVLNCAYARAYRHTARGWSRLAESAASGVDMLPLSSHAELVAEIPMLHGRKAAFWSHVNGTGGDHHDDANAAHDD